MKTLFGQPWWVTVVIAAAVVFVIVGWLLVGHQVTLINGR